MLVAIPAEIIIEHVFYDTGTTENVHTWTHFLCTNSTDFWLQVFDLLHADEAEIAATLRDGARQRVTARLRHADGHYVWVDATGKGIFNDAGEPMTVQTNIRDATERVGAEHESDAALHRFRTAMEHAPIGMAVVDLDGYWLEANQALCSLLDYPVERFRTMTFGEVTHPDDREESELGYRQRLVGVMTVRRSENRYVRRDGVVVWAPSTATLVREPDGTPAYFLVQIQDITSRKRAQEVLAIAGLTDPLTGLPNRLVMVDRLNHAIALARRVGRCLREYRCHGG